MILFSFEREREVETKIVQGSGRQRGRHRFQTVSRLFTVSTEPDTGLKTINPEIMT